MLLSRFLRNCDAGVAPMLALAALPLFGFAGAGIDFSRAASARTAMLAALDATALALSKDAQSLSSAALTEKASEYFNSQFQRAEVYNVQVSHEFSSPQEGSFVLKLTASGVIDTLFTKMLGHSEIAFSASSEVLWGIKRLNLALVLDNTGSMASSSKMTNLKSAAHSLLTTLQNAAKQPDDIKVAIVPFATDVNVGTNNVNAPWIDWTQWEAANGNCAVSSYKSKSSCESHGQVWTPKPRSQWNGCVWDRDQNNDVTNTPTVAGAPATLFRAHQASSCPTSLMPLGHDWPGLHATIDAMAPAGNTNVTIGLAWGFQLLSPVEPFNAPAPEPNLDKVIVMLTDGLNTQNRWTTSESSIDSRTQKVCANIKAANIKVYTVRVIDGDVTLLQNCATNTAMYFNVSEASQLNSVFSSIAQNLANLRIAK
jgi:Flp pilus assembly protein TadG